MAEILIGLGVCMAGASMLVFVVLVVVAVGMAIMGE